MKDNFFAERAVEILGMWITVNRVMKLLKRQKVLFGVEVSKAGQAEPRKSSLSLREEPDSTLKVGFPGFPRPPNHLAR